MSRVQVLFPPSQPRVPVALFISRRSSAQVLPKLKEKAAALPNLPGLSPDDVIPRPGAAADAPLRLRRAKARRNVVKLTTSLQSVFGGLPFSNLVALRSQAK